MRQAERDFGAVIGVTAIVKSVRLTLHNVLAVAEHRARVLS
jgi:hypothetical protein